MKMNEKMSRRRLLKMLAVVAGGIGLSKVVGPLVPQGIAQELDNIIYLPIIVKSSMPNAPRVIHVHGNSATSWDFGNTYYGNYVNQSVVDAMVDLGVMELTGASSVARAWQLLVRNYVPGKAIAIKANFNNCRWCDTSELAIDALIHPVNAVIRGLLQAYPDFNTSDIWIYDATIGSDPSVSPRAIPGRFKAGLTPAYSGVHFFDYNCNEESGYDSSDPTASITWRNPPGIPTPPSTKVTDVLVNASYLINMPIMKRHGGAGVTLSFKNHLGSIAYPQSLHEWALVGRSHYSGDTYNVMVDLYRNSHIHNKTVLTIGDGLFGNKVDNISKPTRWSIFGNGAPNSLFFATDPVAIDCVMCDILNAESALWDEADDYLVYAANVGLGTYERASGGTYTKIDYRKREL